MIYVGKGEIHYLVEQGGAQVCGQSGAGPGGKTPGQRTEDQSCERHQNHQSAHFYGIRDSAAAQHALVNQAGHHIRDE